METLVGVTKFQGFGFPLKTPVEGKDDEENGFPVGDVTGDENFHASGEGMAVGLELNCMAVDSIFSD
jgi:hypothetical protein